MSANESSQLKFSLIVNIIKIHLFAKIGCAHACADIFYSLKVGEIKVENAKNHLRRVATYGGWIVPFCLLAARRRHVKR